jgi:hypothetical protein
MAAMALKCFTTRKLSDQDVFVNEDTPGDVR